MHKVLTLVLVLAALVSVAYADPGINRKPSAHSVADTMDRFETIVKEKGLTVFARVDHAVNAAGVDMSLPPSQLLIFGNPTLGTQLMQERDAMGLDLPLKVLCWEDAQGKTWLAYTRPDVLAKRHGITDNLDVIAKITHALDKMTTAAAAE
jgi:uncharacterized protein (DUF302 family)